MLIWCPCYLYMQEHLIFNFAAHTKTGHLFTDNVSGFSKNIIGPAEGKIIHLSHMRRIRLLTCIHSYSVGKMSNYWFKSASSFLYIVYAISAGFSGTVLMHWLILSTHCFPKVISNKISRTYLIERTHRILTGIGNYCMRKQGWLRRACTAHNMQAQREYHIIITFN